MGSSKLVHGLLSYHRSLYWWVVRLYNKRASFFMDDILSQWFVFSMVHGSPVAPLHWYSMGGLHLLGDAMRIPWGRKHKVAYRVGIEQSLCHLDLKPNELPTKPPANKYTLSLRIELWTFWMVNSKRDNRYTITACDRRVRSYYRWYFLHQTSPTAYDFIRSFVLVNVVVPKRLHIGNF